MSKRLFFLIVVIVAAGLGGGVVYGFWPTVGALAFLFYLAIAWRWTLGVFYFLVAYLPFQVALNLTPDVDLMSGRILIVGLFGVWVAKEILSRSRNKFGMTKSWIPASTGMTEEKRGAKREEKTSDFCALSKNHIFVALALFFILSAVSILGAQNQIWGLRKLLVFASIFPLFWLTAVLIKSKKDAQMLVYVIIGGAGISATIALAQFLGQFIFGLNSVMNFWAARVVPLFSGASFGGLVASNPSWLVNINGQTVMRAIGLFPDPHILSFYLGLTLPLSLAYLFFEKKFCLPLFLVSCFLFLVLLLTFSRGGYLGLLFSLAVFVFFAWQRFAIKDKKFFGATFLLAAAILLLVGWPVVSRLISSFDIQEGSNMGRLSIWQDSWQIIKKNPVIGVGLGNYPLAVNFNQSYRSAVTSHNLYLDIWAETGVFTLLAWLFIFITAAEAAYKKTGQYPVVALGALSGLAYFFAHSFFETAIFNPTVLAMLMVVLGLAAADYEG